MAIDDDEAPKYKQAARKYRGRLLKAKKDVAERDALLNELVDEHEALQSEHEKATSQLGELTSKQKAAAHRAEFDKQAAKANVDPAKLDDLWELAKIETDGDEPDPKELASIVKEQVKKRPYMIKQAKKETEEGNDTDGDENDDTDKGTDADEGDEVDEAPAKTAAKPKLERGEGAARGSRTSLKGPTIDEKIDADFEATGREDAFRI